MKNLITLPVLASCFVLCGCSLFQPANASKTADNLDKASQAVTAGGAATGNPVIAAITGGIGAILGGLALYARHKAADAAFDEGAALAKPKTP